MESKKIEIAMRILRLVPLEPADGMTKEQALAKMLACTLNELQAVEQEALVLAERMLRQKQTLARKRTRLAPLRAALQMNTFLLTSWGWRN